MGWEVLLGLILIALSLGVGGLPIIDWASHRLLGKRLSDSGTGNISVSAAFAQGGKFFGVLAVISEAAKGIGVVALAQIFFPATEVWVIIGLIALVVGRYLWGKGAGTTNVVWGIFFWDSRVGIFCLLLSLVTFTIVRRKQLSKYLVLLILLGVISFFYASQLSVILATIVLCCLFAWIYQTVPDDLDLSLSEVKPESQSIFTWLRGKVSLASLHQPLESQKAGSKAANLSQLQRWGYPIPPGWVLLPETPMQLNSLSQYLETTKQFPVVVRSSAVGEDSQEHSAAGQYQSFLNITTTAQLEQAVQDCRQAYYSEAAQQYRQDMGEKEQKMAVIVQKQINGTYSGVAFSRDPLDPDSDMVVVEAIAGDASLVVSGRVTPEQYKMRLEATECSSNYEIPQSEVIATVARITREIEARYHGIPQDIEWSYDGQKLWLLQTRPITNLQPIWTRKIAAEVIPGLIKPLTWSLNRPLTCGVWGEIFTLVLGRRALGLDFSATATLHYGRAYFNATLLGDIFRRMGLPPESLEFLTRGAKMSKPPWLSTVKNVPGLLRLVSKELFLIRDFERDKLKYFYPVLEDLQGDLESYAPRELLNRIEKIISVLKKATYYSILAPLSLALRQEILKVDANNLNNSLTPEVASLRSLSALARKANNLGISPGNQEELWQHLSALEAGKEIQAELKTIGHRYSYLSETATDVSVPRWGEDSNLVKELFYQFFTNPLPEKRRENESKTWAEKIVQKRLNLKGEVSTIYSQLLAHLRWSFLELGKQWQKSKMLTEVNDIFWLEYQEIRQAILESGEVNLAEIVAQRQSDWQVIEQIEKPPYLVYGNNPVINKASVNISSQAIKGIGASPGEKIGRIKIMQDLTDTISITSDDILVVPYTDAGWSPFLARAGGIIAEVGGRLSHGAIIAREYGIPAVMDIHNATSLLQEGQKVRINGYSGVVEIVNE